MAKVNAYVFSLQLSFTGGATPRPQSPAIPAPQVPRELGANPDADSFADTQVYSVADSSANPDGGNVTLSWTNPRVGAGNITSVTLSYQSNRSSNNKRSITLRGPASSDQLLGDGSEVSYIWTGLQPGLYNFTIAPTLGGIFTGVNVAPGMTAERQVSRPAAANQITPIATIDRADTITGFFPDDGDVQYILTIIQQDDVANPMLRVLSSITGTCSIDPDGSRTLTYDADNQTSATYNVTGIVAGGTCKIDFQVTEDGRSDTLSPSINFNPELPPLLRADVMGDQINVPAQLNVTLVITATKQDGSNTRGVTFPAVVESSSTPSCTATLIGSGADLPRQYDGIIAGTSTAAATYNVRSTDMVPVANCGTFPFAVTEGSTTANSDLAGGISFGEATNKNLAPRVTTNPVGNITDVFPDDGAVSYTLNITKRDILAVLDLSTTASTTGDCSISPNDVISLTYDAENNVITDYNITFTGTRTAGGTCGVEFVATEDGEATTITRSITFSPELAPALVASLIGNGIDVSSTEPVRVNVTATKQDGSNTPSITFPASVVSSSCTATLAGSTARQYDGTIAGTSAVTVTYNVSPTIPSAIDDCGTFTFTAAEGPATGTAEISPPARISFVFVDSDNDGIADGMDNCPMIANPGQSDLNSDGEGDVCDNDNDNDNDDVMDADDVDVDGDGLIELRTAAQLNMMRYNLGGTSLKASADATNNSNGCGDGVTITACNGYEQMANIDLTAAGYANWVPIGTCGGSSCTGSSGAQFFTGVFSGNDFTISNLSINIITNSYGVGFFGAIAPNAQVRNVHIRGGNITTGAGVIASNVGGLAGRGDGATISNSSVTLDEISGVDNVGGLVGWSNAATISSSVATVGSISGVSYVGGLAGDGASTTISSSVAIVGSVSGTSYVGGLVGWGNGAPISSSVATVGSVSGIFSHVGGLVGNGPSAIISSSVATVGSVSGTFQVGGLAGLGSDATISSSVATVGAISGIQYVSGLVGDGPSATISSSVAVTNSITGIAHVGGLVGASGDIVDVNHDPSSVTASYWDSNVSFVNAAQLSSNTFGSAQTTSALQTPVATGDGSFPAGIYADWDNAYCNPNTGAYSATAPDQIGDYVRVWDLGEDDEYPAITCARSLFPLAEQRAATARVIAGESPLVD